MATSGPLILIDDDADDEELVREALQEIGIINKLMYFNNCSDAYTYLKTTTDSPLLILCDVNLPRQNGIEFKRQVDNDQLLRQKSIPFVFFSTAVDKKAVDTAFKEMTVQGFFQKSSSFQELKEVLHLIISYWKLCRHPNS